MKKQGSNLVTPTGLIALAVLLLVSAYLRIRQLELLLAAAFILCLAAWLWARNSLRRISVEVLDEDCRAFPGQLVEASARLKNEKYLPVIWLRADFPTGDNACVVPVGDGDEPLFPDPNTGERPELSEHFLWVMPHQSVSWSQRAMAVRRGVCRISRVELMSGDGFGLAEETRPAQLEAGFRFIVYPAVRPVSVAPIIRNLSEMERARSGFYTDRTLISSFRPYRDGDSFKDINWRLLARTGSVQVNVHERLDMRRVCLVPDLESFMVMQEVESGTEKRLERGIESEGFEAMLSLVASAAAALGEKGVLCSLVIPAYAGRRAHIVVPDDAETQVPQLLTALAEIDYSGEETDFPESEMVESHHLLGQLFLFSRRAPDGEDTLSARLGGLPVFTVVSEGGEDGADRYIISERELTAV